MDILRRFSSGAYRKLWDASGALFRIRREYLLDNGPGDEGGVYCSERREIDQITTAIGKALEELDGYLVSMDGGNDPAAGMLE
jgi:hypothetical protein